MSKKLTHADKRNKQRAHTPAAKRRHTRTMKMRVRSIEVGTRRSKVHPNGDRGASTPVHKARVPGTVRLSRMPGGSSFRNNWEA